MRFEPFPFQLCNRSTIFRRLNKFIPSHYFILTFIRIFCSTSDYDNKARSNRDILDRLRSDVRRYGDRVRVLESSIQEHAIARADLQQVGFFRI